MADLSVKLGGLELKNPVMTASGTFGYGLEFADFVNRNYNERYNHRASRRKSLSANG